MKVKTSDLIGAPLDWAVAQCKGFKKIYAMAAWSNKHGAHGGPQVMVSNEEDSSFDYRPSSNWAQGGPIIDRMMKGVFFFMENDDGRCHAAYSETEHDNAHGHGPTPLIAACRCLVASKLGDEVDIPEELLK